MDDPKPVLLVGLRRPEGASRDWGEPEVGSRRCHQYASVRRMEWLLGVKRGCLLEAVDAVNLLGPSDEASALRLRTAALAVDVEDRELLILCGREVHLAFGFGCSRSEGEPRADTGRLSRVRGCDAVLLPHPSGRNRDWNDTDFSMRVRAALAESAVPLLPRETIREGTPQEQASILAASRAGVWRGKVVQAYEAFGELVHACRAAGVTDRTVRIHRARDPEFDAEVRAAYDRFRARVAVGVVQVGLYGVERPIYQGGKLVGHETVRDTAALLRLAERHDPAWRRTSTTQVAGHDGGPLGPVILPALEVLGAPADEPKGGEKP